MRVFVTLWDIVLMSLVGGAVWIGFFMLLKWKAKKLFKSRY